MSRLFVVLAAMLAAAAPCCVQAADASSKSRSIQVIEKAPPPAPKAPAIAAPQPGQAVSPQAAPAHAGLPAQAAKPATAPGALPSEAAKPVTAPAALPSEAAKPVQPPLPGGQENQAVPATATAATPPVSPPTPQGVKGPGGITVSLANPAGVSLQFLPGDHFVVGDKLQVRVTSQVEGYLVLVDISSDGHVTQIFPNLFSLKAGGQGNEQDNLLRPGKALVVPDPNSDKTSFEYVAGPPFGQGMLVAIVSDKAVQYIDLPDIPANMQGERGVQFVQEQTRSLKITPAAGGALLDPTWSFAVSAYTVDSSVASHQQN
jgi:hypothetical protein